MWVEETKNQKFKFVERYTDYLTGQTKKVSVTLDKNTTQTRKIAQKALDEKIEQACQFCTDKQYTMKDLVKAYRVEQEVTVKKSTYSRNYFACKALMEILGENTLVTSLTAKYVRQRMLATGKEPGTLNECLTRFKALIRWGYQNDIVPDISFLNKLEAFKDIPHREKIQDKYLEAEELKTLVLGMNMEIWQLVTQFLAFSGLRFGEAAALSKEDVDIENQMIHVSKTYDHLNEVTTTPKTRCSNRDVYMQDELRDVCKKIKRLMLQQRLMYAYQPTKLFLESQQGEHIKYPAYHKFLKENAEKLLGRRITPHTLRHTHASLLLENGVDIDTISRRLGHENSQVTREIYLHVTEKLKEKDNAKIAKVKIM